VYYSAMQTREQQIELENTALRKFQLAADDICHQIRRQQQPREEIDRQISELRKSAERLFPHKMELFDLIYMKRFERLWREQS
jgi:hypothetical protein